MVTTERYRDLVTGRAETYSQAVRLFADAYDIKLPRRTIHTADIQGIKMKYSYDLAHKDDHLLELCQIAELMVHQRPSLLGEVNWPQTFDFISLHDDGRGRIPLTPITLFSSQFLEYALAPLIARRHMEQHWMGEIDEELLGIIARHPFHAGHRLRAGKVYSVTERLDVDIDGLSVLTPSRVDKLYMHIQKGLFGLPLAPFHGLLSHIFNTFTQFAFFYPEAENIANVWRPEA